MTKPAVTLAPDHPIAWNLSPRPRTARTGCCASKCAGGYPCDCDARYKHQLHCCHREDCVCHSREHLDGQRGGEGR